MRMRTAGLLVALGLAVAACGVVPRAAPFDPVINDTVVEFDKAFQTFAVDMNRKAGTPAGEHGANTAFYVKWHGELAHLRNRAIATDPADTCPLSGQVTEVLQVVAEAGGSAGQALSAPGDLLALASGALARVEARLDALADELNQPAGTLTPDVVDRLRAEADALEARRARFEAVLTGLADTEVAVSEGGCSTVVVADMAAQFVDFERVHRLQGPIGLKRPAPVILMNVTIQNVLKVQAVKKAKTEAGLL